MRNFKIEYSYEQEFKNLWRELNEKYPDKIFDIDGVGKQLDLAGFSRDFFQTGNNTATADISVDANANVSDKSIISYNYEWGKPLEKFNSYYLLWKEMRKIYNAKIARDALEANIAGDIYINDQHGISGGKYYCFNYATYDVMMNGLPFVTKIKSFPPKYLYGFKSQLEQFLIIAGGSSLGATGIADLLAVFALYADNILDTMGDGHFKFATQEDCWTYVRETLISLIYTINQPLRANQSLFCNVSLFDKYFMESIVGNYTHPTTGKKINFEVLAQLQEMYLDIMNEEMKRTPITFPVTTACFMRDDNGEILDKEFLDLIAKKSVDYGFINFYIGKTGTLSSCCRLRSDTQSEYFNSFGTGGSRIGSLSVATINLPRIAMKSKGNEKTFFNELEKKINLCFQINYTRRKLINEKIEEGFHPLYTHGFVDLRRQYSTCGVNGFNEAIELMNKNPLEQDGIDFGLKLIDKINAVNESLGKHFDVPVNCEQIPAESVSIKLAAKDRVLNYNNKYELYSNQFIPLTSKADLIDRIRLQGIYDSRFSGGAIAHLNVGQQITDYKKIVALIEKCAHSNVVYFAINYVILELEDGSMVVGSRETTEMGGKKVVNYFTRVVGFMVNTKHFAKERREFDFPNRTFYEDCKY